VQQHSSKVELAEGTSSTLALALQEALARNTGRPGALDKLDGQVLVRAEDTGATATLDFGNGRVRVSDGEPESPRVRILGDEQAILALTRVPHGRLPKVWSRGGREVLKRQLGGELTIRGLVLRSPTVVRLLRLLAD
jgi:hypothetical protein